MHEYPPLPLLGSSWLSLGGFSLAEICFLIGFYFRFHFGFVFKRMEGKVDNALLTSFLIHKIIKYLSRVIVGVGGRAVGDGALTVVLGQQNFRVGEIGY